MCCDVLKPESWSRASRDRGENRDSSAGPACARGFFGRVGPEKITNDDIDNGCVTVLLIAVDVNLSSCEKLSHSRRRHS